jgi:para-nitrobenzyl esterase
VLASLSLHGAEAELQVTVQSGIVQGKAQGAVRAFLGIPYAAPPVGHLRWQPPVPAAPWAGVRLATEFGPRPMQPTIYKDMIFRDPGCSEDCLSLNVWTPAKTATAKLPVMVWIFGGGFQAGGTSEQRQDGAHLAERGVVVVSMNYRLGAFGFMVHPELIAESPQHAAGNYGLLDQLEALRWVRANIAAFGGDPGNVTIFGESAGSASVSAQMASPLAKGLLHRAIGESGAAGFSGGGLGQKPLATRAIEDREAMTKITGAHTLAELRAMPAQALLDAIAKAPAGNGIRFGVVVDGYFLPDTAASLFAAGKQNDVPLLAGWNRDEQGLALGTKTPPIEAMRKTAHDEFGEHAGEFLRLYPADSPEHAARSGAEFAADRFIAYGTWAWLEAQTKTGRQPVYRYRFDRAPPTNFFGSKTSGVYHSADILYVFGSFDAQPQVPWEDADRAASDRIQSYWVNFARTGNPNRAGLPGWPAYSALGDWPVMHLDATPAARPDDFRARYLFLAREWKN